MKRALLVILAACDHALDQRLAIVDEPRVLAVIAEPAEAHPGEPVTYSTIVASPDGPIADAPDWAYCLAPKPPTEDNAVSDACLRGDMLAELGTAQPLAAMLPADGCVNFGPDVPMAGFRPRDPDPTGGFYQPIRAEVDALTAFGLSRITCKLGSAPFDVARDYDMNYHANANPTLDPIALTTVPADTDVALTATWPADAAESYLFFEPLSQTLITRREAMRVSWFATAGAIAVDASAVGEADSASTVSTTWHTPAAGTAWLWFVLRDSRGGVAVQQAQISVE